MSIILTIAIVIFAEALTSLIMDNEHKKEHRKRMNELFNKYKKP